MEIRKEGSLRAYINALRRFLIWHPVLDELYYIVSRIFRSKLQIIQTTLGSRMLVDISKAGIHKVLFVYHQLEPECTEIFLSMIPRKAIVLDIGANIGYYVLVELQKADKVYAIEPAPQNVEFLKQNITMNSCDDCVEVYPLAMSDKKDKALFSVEGLPNRFKLIVNPSKFHKDAIYVDTMTVDEFLINRRVNVLRMDIEGAEWLVVRGMTDTLRQLDNLRVLFIELHITKMKDYGGNALELVNLLLTANFEIKYIVLREKRTKVSIGSFTRRTLPLKQVLKSSQSFNKTTAVSVIEKIIKDNIDCWLFMER